MPIPIFSSENHKRIVEVYINLCKKFAQEVSSKTKYQNFLDVLNLIYEYHNGYGEGVRENNYYDWIMIIPINISVAINGFFAGVETKKNASVIRAYKVVLDEVLQETVNKLDNLELKNE